VTLLQTKSDSKPSRESLDRDEEERPEIAEN
jgi:hypothetical protein